MVTPSWLMLAWLVAPGLARKEPPAVSGVCWCEVKVGGKSVKSSLLPCPAGNLDELVSGRGETVDDAPSLLTTRDPWATSCRFLVLLLVLVRFRLRFLSRILSSSSIALLPLMVPSLGPACPAGTASRPLLMVRLASSAQQACPCLGFGLVAHSRGAAAGARPGGAAKLDRGTCSPALSQRAQQMALLSVILVLAVRGFDSGEVVSWTRRPVTGLWRRSRTRRMLVRIVTVLRKMVSLESRCWCRWLSLIYTLMCSGRCSLPAVITGMPPWVGEK